MRIIFTAYVWHWPLDNTWSWRLQYIDKFSTWIINSEIKSEDKEEVRKDLENYIKRKDIKNYWIIENPILTPTVQEYWKQKILKEEFVQNYFPELYNEILEDEGFT